MKPDILQLLKQKNTKTHIFTQIHIFSHKYKKKQVPGLDGVGTCKDAGSGIQRGNNACLRNGHCLLLHCFMQDRTSLVRHLFNYHIIKRKIKQKELTS